MTRRNQTRDEARSELAAYLKGTKYEIKDPLAPLTLEQQARKAGNMLGMLQGLNRVLDQTAATRARSTRDIAQLADDYKRELGECRRCEKALVGEIVEIVSGLTGSRFYTHLDCIESGDELVENVEGAL